MPTPAERRDLGQAWNHLSKAIEEVRSLPTPQSGVEASAARLTAMQEMSDARRIIDRVREGRSYDMPLKSMDQVRALHRMLVKRVPLRGDQEVLKELALDIHQALADAAAGRDEAMGVSTLCGSEEN